MENFKLFFSQPPAETTLSAAIYQNILYSDCILIIFQPLIVFSIFFLLTCTVLSLLIY